MGSLEQHKKRRQHGILVGSLALAAFDFGQSTAQHSGAADARSAYDLLGGLEAVVSAPQGPEGGALSFLAGDFIIHPVRLHQPKSASGSQP
jgi:hypothetical protein